MTECIEGDVNSDTDSSVDLEERLEEEELVEVENVTEKSGEPDVVDLISKRRKSHQSPVSRSKLKYKGAFQYKTKFCKEWVRKWPFISSVTDDPRKVRCNVCAKTVNISHQVAADIKVHIKTKTHTKRA